MSTFLQAVQRRGRRLVLPCRPFAPLVLTHPGLLPTPRTLTRRLCQPLPVRRPFSSAPPRGTGSSQVLADVSQWWTQASPWTRFSCGIWLVVGVLQVVLVWRVYDLDEAFKRSEDWEREILQKRVEHWDRLADALKAWGASSHKSVGDASDLRDNFKDKEAEGVGFEKGRQAGSDARAKLDERFANVKEGCTKDIADLGAETEEVREETKETAGETRADMHELKKTVEAIAADVRDLKEEGMKPVEKS
ncbi:hypothetical protein JCM6882_001175 [Rhodosporidiobolus microsporus]